MDISRSFCVIWAAKSVVGFEGMQGSEINVFTRYHEIAYGALELGFAATKRLIIYRPRISD
jgi:hypothetical protein